jgi:hypothetical protein
VSETFPDVCPRCAGAMEAGFAGRATPLSFVATGKLDRLSFKDEDLVKAGWRTLFPSRARYFRSYLCRACKLYAIDYAKTYTRDEAEKFRSA